jgi:hypothetical protein
MLTKEDLKSSFITYLTLYPALFGKKHVDNGFDMCDNVSEYIEKLFEDDEFKKDFEGHDARAHGRLYSEQAYKRYREGYENAKKDIKRENDLMLAEGFKQYNFNSLNDVVKYIRAVKDILYNCRKSKIANSVIRLTSWLQWFRQGLSPQKDLHIEPSALIFYSAIGGTGKSEIVNAFARACDELGVERDYLSTSDLCTRFAPQALKESNAIIIEEAEFIPKLGLDINLPTINKIIDRQQITYEEKLKKPKPIKTNLSLICTTNNRFYNRRYSFIIINEEELNIEKHKPPSPERLKQAWIEAIKYCPNPLKKFVPIMVNNQKNPFPISDNILKIYDMVENEGDYYEKGVRAITNIITKGAAAPKLSKMILSDIKYLISLGICEKIVRNKNHGLAVSSVRFNLEKFRDFIDSEPESGDMIAAQDVEEAVIENYVRGQEIASNAEIETLLKNIKDCEKEIKDWQNYEAKTTIERKNKDAKMMKLVFKLDDLKQELKNAQAFLEVLQKSGVINNETALKPKPPPP